MYFSRDSTPSQSLHVKIPGTLESLYNCEVVCSRRSERNDKRREAKRKTEGGLGLTRPDPTRPKPPSLFTWPLLSCLLLFRSEPLEQEQANCELNQRQNERTCRPF